MRTVNTNISRQTNKLSAQIVEREKEMMAQRLTNPYTSDKLLIRAFIII